jgi:hypothetical protein
MEQTKVNGIAKNATATQKNNVLTLPAPANSPETKKATPPVISAPIEPEKTDEKQPAQTFEERMQRLSQLFELQGKYDKLKQSDDKLKDFTIKGNEGAELELEDSEGNVFSTKNAEIVSDVVQFLKMKIAEKRKVLEAQIRW